MSIAPINPQSNGVGIPPAPATSLGGRYPAPLQNNNLNQNLDLYGALMRRKFLVILLAIVGALLGYLFYLKAPVVYSSGLRMMIWSKTPPKIIDGESLIRAASAPKHENLIMSEIVLDNAISNGKLHNLQMFTDAPSTIGYLKRSLSIKSESGDQDTIILKCDGSIAEDLPVVLNQVVNAYEEILYQDSRDVGKDLKDLFQKYQDKTAGELRTAEDRYLVLAKKHGLTARLKDGDFVNPYIDRLYDTQKERDRLERAHSDIRLQLSSREAIINAGSEEQRAVLAIEAQRFLGTEYKTVLNSTAALGSAGNTLLSTYNQQVGSLQRAVFELDTRRQDLMQIHGPGSPRVRNLTESIEKWQKELKRLEAARDRLIKVAMPDTGGQETKVVDQEALKKAQENYWVNLHSISLRKELQNLTSTIEELDTKIGGVEKNAMSISDDITELNILKRQIEDKRAESREILERLSEVDLVSNDYNSYKVRIIDSPKIGSRKSPDFIRSLGLGALLGSLLGTGLALLVDKFDLSYRNPNEILESLNIPVVGKVPRIKQVATDSGEMSTLVMAHKPGSVGAESFRAIRTAMFFAASASNWKTFLFTSPSPGDGKSTICCNIAISIAQTGKRVLLLDADFRRPMVHTYFNEELEPGLLGYLYGDKKLKEVVLPSCQPNLFLLPTGGRPKNPGELVTSKEFDNVLKKLKESFDFILIDSPPVLPVADPTVLATKVDAAYLVMRIRKGIKISAQNAKDNLDRVSSNTVGIIVNGVDQNPYYSEYGYYYQYNGGYGSYGYGTYGGYSPNGPTITPQRLSPIEQQTPQG